MNTNASGIPVRLRSPQRHQRAVVYQCLDDLLPPDHLARVLWEVTGKLDLSPFHRDIKAVQGTAGRDHTDPRLLVSLWLYACTDGVGSARELDRLCRESDPYQWLCGDVSLNYHTLSDFRVNHGPALDELFTNVLASLADQGIIALHSEPAVPSGEAATPSGEAGTVPDAAQTLPCISQDGLRVRGSAGADSFRRKERLQELVKQARQKVEDLRKQLEDPAYAAQVSARQKAARQRAARERVERIEQALAQLPELEEAQQELSQRCSQTQKQQMEQKRQPRASTTDPEVRRMKMPDGGYRPAVNVQVATETQSRIIVGVEVSNRGVDNAGQGPAMRQQVQERLEAKVGRQLVDGGYLKTEDIEQAAREGVELYVPPKEPRNKAKRSSGCDPKPGDSPAVAAWRARMGSEAGQALYKLRASTSETVNADLRCFRGLGQLTVRGLAKIRCVVLWSALAYNLMHCAAELIG